jgi:hypothetical protein
MKLGYVFLGVFLSLFGFVSGSWGVPVTIAIVAIYSGIFFFIFGLFERSRKETKPHPEIIDKIEDETMNALPYIAKGLAALLSLAMFGGSALLIYSAFNDPWGALLFFPFFAAVITCILGVLLLYVAIEL